VALACRPTRLAQADKGVIVRVSVQLEYYTDLDNGAIQYVTGLQRTLSDCWRVAKSAETCFVSVLLYAMRGLYVLLVTQTTAQEGDLRLYT
jgi:hypothetical protein